MIELDRIELQPLPEFDLTPDQREALLVARDWTKAFFDAVPEGTHIGGHGFDKTMRQAGTAAHLSHMENYPVFLPTLTAMIMDVGRISQDPRARSFKHGELSKEMIVPLFETLSILTPEERELVGNAVEDHPKLNENVRRNPVVEIAMDADRLDCLGALGPLRAATWRPNIPLILPEETGTSGVDTDIMTIWQDMADRQMEWLDMIWTESAREIMKPRIDFYRQYLEELKLETSFMYQAYKKLGL